MSEFITVKHSYNAGDLVTILPGLQKIFKETGKKSRILQRIGLRADYGHRNDHPIKDESGYNVCMNVGMFEMLKPLIEYQEYIESFQIWAGEKTAFDIDQTRMSSQIPLPFAPIHQWVSLVYPQLECDLSRPWIKTKGVQGVTPYVIVNFTERYRNDYITYHFLQEYQRFIRFVGTEHEYKTFKEKNNLHIEYWSVVDFLQLASLINGSSFFLGNQSFCYHLADSMKKNRILEVCQSYPNSFPTGANGHSFLTQSALEWQFSKLMNEATK